MEWSGRWSYSLYLIHNMAIAGTPLAATAPAQGWLLRIVAIVAGSLAFYAIVEAPSHWLARSASRRLAGWLAKLDAARPQLASP
jgi:peptidoglycan/LPS O-acetylase OafA/YrhL